MTLAFEQNLEGEAENQNATHFFVIRNDPSVSVQNKDFVVWENRLMIVMRVQPAGDHREYLRIHARDHDIVDFPSIDDIVDGDGTPFVDDVAKQSIRLTTEEEDPAPPPNARNNPYWDDPA